MERIEEISAWIGQKTKSGEIKKSTGRLWTTSLRQLLSVLSEDELVELDQLSEKIPILAERWGNQNPRATSDTISTYESRARSAVNAYLSWKSDPKMFRFASRATVARKPRERGLEKHENSALDASGLRTFPLGIGRRIDFRLPDDGFTVKEMLRFAIHIATFAQDFEPSQQLVISFPKGQVG